MGLHRIGSIKPLSCYVGQFTVPSAKPTVPSKGFCENRFSFNFITIDVIDHE